MGHLLQHPTKGENSLSYLLYCKGHGWSVIDNKGNKPPKKKNEEVVSEKHNSPRIE
jgi:hypothetical protein